MLITGATGLVGGQILSRYLEGSEGHVYALVRAPGAEEAAKRLRATMASIYGSEDAFADRLTAVPGDLERSRLGLDRRRLDELAERVTEIVHAAASVSFSMPLERAREVNLAGTERALELAALCQRRGRLRRFSYVSTTYVAGTHDSVFHEDELDVGQEFRNSYEQSKFEAERLVRECAERIPVRIFRPGIVVGERSSGWTSAFSALYYPVKLFARGVNPPIVPARRDTVIDAVPVDYVADAIFNLGGRLGPSGETFNLVAGSDATTVGELLDASARYFNRRPPTLVPLALYMRTLHPVLKRSYRGSRKRQLQRGADFLPYFSMRQRFDDSGARRALEPLEVRASPLSSYFERLLEFAVASEWGRIPISRADARRMALGEWPGESSELAAGAVG
jgi:thioester reductase-like protein